MENKLTETEAFSIEETVRELEIILENPEVGKRIERQLAGFTVEAAGLAVANQSENMKALLDQYEILKYVIMEKLSDLDADHRSAYLMGQFAGAFDFGNTWYKINSQNLEFEQNMKRLLSKKHILEIINCVNENPGIQNKRIAEYLDIKPNHLRELTKELVFYKILNRYILGKNTFYELTPKAKELYRDKRKKEMQQKYLREKLDFFQGLVTDAGNHTEETLKTFYGGFQSNLNAGRKNIENSYATFKEIQITSIDYNGKGLKRYV